MSSLSPSLIAVADEIDRESRIVVHNATADENFDLVPELHANRVFVLNAIVASGALQFRLPYATGTGNRYTIINNAVQTQSVVITAKSGELMHGTAFVFDSTAATNGVDCFIADGTDDVKYTFNATTMGGLKGDRFQAVDIATGVWVAEVFAVASGNVASGWA